MANLYLDSNGLTTLWNKIKGTFVPQTRKVNGKALSSDITLSASDVSALPSSTTIPTATTTTPKMDGTAAVGSETKWARGDHVHPSDTSKVDKVDGMGLSENDYTTTEKTKLAGITAGADKTRLYIGGSAATSSIINNGDTIRIIGDSFITTAAGYSQGDEPQIQVSLNSSKFNVASGLLQLNSSAKIDSTYLPSYVDDIIEAYPRGGQTALSQNWLATESASGTVITPESGKIYILMAASGDYGVNSQFRWTGSGSTGTYVEIYNTSGFSPIPDATINALS